MPLHRAVGVVVAINSMTARLVRRPPSRQAESLDADERDAARRAELVGALGLVGRAAVRALDDWRAAIHGDERLAVDVERVPLVVLERMLVPPFLLTLENDLLRLAFEVRILFRRDLRQLEQPVRERRGRDVVLDLEARDHRRLECQQEVRRLQVTVGEIRPELGHAHWVRNVGHRQLQPDGGDVLACDVQQLLDFIALGARGGHHHGHGIQDRFEQLKALGE
mmetsp:Transcript_42874/g.115376  ORF Transcript_42874/g.115376 Transcript_42874/m.115376 type:complete len:223 (-) Transcript_42874:2035-2703(-)